MLFSSFSLPGPVLQAAKELGYETPTLIQEKTIPLILQGKDVVGQSETGSGKTAAFGLPIIGQLRPRGVQMLVVTPTRELCNQVAGSLARFSKHLHLQVGAVYGGVGMNPQIRAFQTAQIIVACPGRLLDLMSQGVADLRNVRFLVLDEADRMFDMGFIRDIEKILRAIPPQRQTLLFSATMPNEVKTLVQRYMRQPVFIDTESHVDKTKLREFFYEVQAEDKFSLLAHLLKHEMAGTALVFCGKRHVVDKVAKNLRKNGVDAIPIHGGLSQNKRDQAIEALHNKDVTVLVATDIAARGLHIKDITHVYNYDLPNVPEDYTHRIGRTARAGAEGDAITLLSERDRDLLRPILRLGHDMKKLPTPQFERIILPKGRPGAPRFQSFGHRRSHEGQNLRTGFHDGRSRGRTDGEGNQQRSNERSSDRPRGENQHRGARHQHNYRR